MSEQQILTLPIDRILHGDCLEVLKGLPSASYDSIVTDPPYGLGTREPTIEDIVAYLLGNRLDTGGDFMGHAWDIPSVAVWRECYRVLKPGGYLMSFAGTRTLDLMSLGIRAAGFENRDTFACQFGPSILSWIHSQGFPKSLNILETGICPMVAEQLVVIGALTDVKAVKWRHQVKDAPTDVEPVMTYKVTLVEKEFEIALYPDETFELPPELIRWKGYGTALKPSWEPILVFRRPLEETTVARQVLATGTGGLNIDATRVQGAQGDGHWSGDDGSDSTSKPGYDGGFTKGGQQAAQGRWPSNLLFVHAPGCKCVGTDKVPSYTINRFTDGMKPFGDGAGHEYESTQAGDADGMETVELWDCVSNCPIRLLNDMSGVTRSGAMKQEVPGYEGDSNTPFLRGKSGPSNQRADEGGASRFFPAFAPIDAPFFYTAKVSKSEATCNGRVVNEHPTRKALALMRWLVRLATPPGGVVLDPYCGSGSTCVASVQEGLKFTGIEKEEKFVATSKARTDIAIEEHRGKQSQAEAFDMMDLMAQEGD